jgi:hypothetical protein
MKMHRRMQRRIRMVVEERRMSVAAARSEPAADPDATVEIPTTVTLRAIGRATIAPA